MGVLLICKCTSWGYSDRVNGTEYRLLFLSFSRFQFIKAVLLRIRDFWDVVRVGLALAAW